MRFGSTIHTCCEYCGNTTVILSRKDDHAVLCLRGNSCRSENMLTPYTENQLHNIALALTVRG